MDLLMMIFASMQGLCVVVPCALIELLLITALIECFNNKDVEGGRLMLSLMKAVAVVPLLWLTLVLVIGCFG